ncbi:hypothetical protein R1sor_017088 [Riccia sorocarpa]|uniref:Retroviral polymerase SH3-like domain-containing protein n=1 Tax=Riccia sorocarpa TaxID=122646 RepID=A0ABD3I6A9_9MARC
MLATAQLGDEFWAEAAQTAVYILNRTATRTLQGKTPLEAWNGEKPNVAYFRTWGCDAYALIPKKFRSKLEPKSEKCKFMGYCHGPRTYKLWDPAKRKMKETREVIFHEVLPSIVSAATHVLESTEKNDDVDPTTKQAESTTIDYAAEADDVSDANTQAVQDSVSADVSSRLEETTTDEEQILDQGENPPPLDLEVEPTTSRKKGTQDSGSEMLTTKRNRRPSERLGEWDYGNKQSRAWIAKAIKVASRHPLEPKNFKEAVNKSTWKLAMDEEFESLLQMALGIRTVVRVAAVEDMELIQFDVQTAFINSGLEEEIYMMQSEGYAQRGREHLTRYIETLVERFGPKDAYPMSTPADPNTKLQASDNSDDMELVLYQEAVGSIMFAFLGSRPDIAYALSIVAKYCSNPCRAHWEAVKRILRYLKGTSDYRLCFRPDGKTNIIHGFCDADYAADLDTRRSRSGYIFILNGSPIAWLSQQQGCVATSTT